MRNFTVMMNLKKKNVSYFSFQSCYPSTPVINNLTSCSPLEKFSPVDVSPIKRIEKSVKCNNLSFMMQVDSAVQGDGFF